MSLRAKFDPAIWSHPKVRSASPGARWLYLAGTCWSVEHMTDGVIRPMDLEIIGGTPDQADELVRAGLWETKDGAWSIHDFFDYQEPAAEAKRRREIAVYSGRMGAHARGRGPAEPPPPPPSVWQQMGPTDPQGESVFKDVWRTLPKRRYSYTQSDKHKARRMFFEMIQPEERSDLLRATRLYARERAEDVKRRGESAKEYTKGYYKFFQTWRDHLPDEGDTEDAPSMPEGPPRPTSGPNLSIGLGSAARRTT